jgi:hypothetical protein
MIILNLEIEGSSLPWGSIIFRLDKVGKKVETTFVAGGQMFLLLHGITENI